MSFVRRTALVFAVALAATLPSAFAQSLEFTLWSSNAAHLELLGSIADAYQAEHPDVTIRFASTPLGEYDQKIVVQIAGGTPPAAGWVIERSAPTFIEANVLADLRPALEAFPGYDLADVSAAALQLWTRGDAIYGMPFSTSPFVVFYNRDMFAAAGIPTPDEQLIAGTWTWDALAEAAAAISAATPAGVYGFEPKDNLAYTDRVWDTIVPLVWAYGGEAWNEDGTTCGLASPEAVAGVEHFHRMVFADGGAVPPGEQANFFAGQSGMTVSQISRVAQLADASFKWDIAPLPAGPAGTVQVIGQAALAVFAANAHADVAADFVAFATTRENVTRLARFFPPARASVLASPDVLAANPAIDPFSFQTAVVEGIAVGRTLPSHVSFPQIDLAARAAFDAVWRPDADVAAAMRGVCDAISVHLR